MAKPKKQPDVDSSEQLLEELTADLQRTRADFENYRKRVDAEKHAARQAGQAHTITKLLPIIDTVERAVTHMPTELHDNKWAQGIVGLNKNLEKLLETLDLKKIDTVPGTAFNPELHEAIQFDDTAEGEHEVIAEVLQAGYLLNGQPLRHAMVKVTRQ